MKHLMLNRPPLLGGCFPLYRCFLQVMCGSTQTLKGISYVLTHTSLSMSEAICSILVAHFLIEAGGTTLSCTLAWVILTISFTSFLSSSSMNVRALPAWPAETSTLIRILDFCADSIVPAACLNKHNKQQQLHTKTFSMMPEAWVGLSTTPV